MKNSFPTWHNVPKANGSHGDEAEVESIKEGPVLPEGEQEGTTTEEDDKEDQSSSNCVHVVTKPHLFFIIIIIPDNDIFRYSINIKSYFLTYSDFCLTMLYLTRTGLTSSLYFLHTLLTIVAKICPTSAMTESVKGTPTIANAIQKSLPSAVTGAMLP